MYKNTRYALFTEYNEITGEYATYWYTYASRKQAQKVIENGQLKAGTTREVEFTGEILTNRQMQKRGLLNG